MAPNTASSYTGPLENTLATLVDLLKLPPINVDEIYAVARDLDIKISHLLLSAVAEGAVGIGLVPSPASATRSDTTEPGKDSTVTTAGDSRRRANSVSATSEGTTAVQPDDYRDERQAQCDHYRFGMVRGELIACEDCGKEFTNEEYFRWVRDNSPRTRHCTHTEMTVSDGSWPECTACGKTFPERVIRSTQPTAAVKNTVAEGKALIRYDLIAQTPLEELAKLLGYGANKYAERNWEHGFRWSTPVNAMLRHLKLFLDGEDIDPDSGAPHVVAIMCNAMFLAEFRHTHPELDDRKGGPYVQDLQTGSDG